MRIEAYAGGEAMQSKLGELFKKLQNAKLVKVGFLEGSTYPDGTPVAMVAAIQNYGAPAAGIPARPFFSNMVAEKSPKWGEQMAAVAKANDFDAHKTLDAMGQGIQGQLQAAISDFDSVPLAASTVAKKGFDKQLIDTNHMRNSADYEVEA